VWISDGKLPDWSGDLMEAIMLRTIEVEIDLDGRIHPLEPLPPLAAGRALLTLMSPPADEAAMLAEASLAEDWLKPQEDEAWASLQPGSFHGGHAANR
jgi:hypothetical protein